MSTKKTCGTTMSVVCFCVHNNNEMKSKFNYKSCKNETEFRFQPIISQFKISQNFFKIKKNCSMADPDIYIYTRKCLFYFKCDKKMKAKKEEEEEEKK